MRWRSKEAPDDPFIDEIQFSSNELLNDLVEREVRQKSPQL
jgi:hypothetical protein